MDALAHAELQNAFLRIVTPMRREFGIAVDVPRMRIDRAYAGWLVALGLTGRAPILLGAASHIAGYLKAAEARDGDARRLRTNELSEPNLPA